jgi:hypothetical protein
MHEDRIHVRAAGRAGGQPRPRPLLSSLDVGDRLPWKLDAGGEPLWLTVTEVLGEGSCLVRYPDGTSETLTDSE